MNTWRSVGLRRGTDRGHQPVIRRKVWPSGRRRSRGAGPERHCRDAGYKVTYWYLDNEPWNEGNANYTLGANTYAEEVLVYGTPSSGHFRTRG